MRRSYKRRLRSLKGAINRRRKLFKWTVIVVGGGWALKFFGELILGDWIIEYIRPYLSFVLPTIKAFSQWATSHLAETSVILLATSLIFILWASYFETRPPKGIKIDEAKPFDHLGPYWGVQVTNHTGEDLHDCWVDILDWGEYENLGKAIVWHWNNNAVDISAEHSQDYYFIHRWNGTYKATIRSNGPQLPQGTTEIALSFHANTNEGETITQNFWMDVLVEWDDAEERDEIELGKIST